VTEAVAAGAAGAASISIEPVVDGETETVLTRTAFDGLGEPKRSSNEAEGNAELLAGAPDDSSVVAKRESNVVSRLARRTRRGTSASAESVP